MVSIQLIDESTDLSVYPILLIIVNYWVHERLCDTVVSIREQISFLLYVCDDPWTTGFLDRYCIRYRLTEPHLYTSVFSISAEEIYTYYNCDDHCFWICDDPPVPS